MSQLHDRLILAMIHGQSRDALLAACAKDGVADPETAIQTARLALTRTAEVNREEALAVSLGRYGEIYKRSMAIAGSKDADPDISLKAMGRAQAAQKQIDELSGLRLRAGQDRPPPSDPAEVAELDAVLAHLAPMGLVPADSPASDHARAAASMLMDAHVRGVLAVPGLSRA